MSTMIQYKDGMMVEVATPKDRAVAASGTKAEKLSQEIATATRSLGPILGTLADVLDGLYKRGLKGSEIKLGVGFSLEGNIFVTKVASEATLEVTLKYGAKE